MLRGLLKDVGEERVSPSVREHSAGGNTLSLTDALRCELHGVALVAYHGFTWLPVGGADLPHTFLNQELGEYLTVAGVGRADAPEC